MNPRTWPLRDPTLLVGAVLFFAHSAAESSPSVSAILNNLLGVYDKHVRPFNGSSPIDVGITMHVIDICDVSEEELIQLSLTLYMRQTWIDSRLAFGFNENGTIKTLIVSGGDYLDRIWRPDTFFPNAKKAEFHGATQPNAFFRIASNGQVTTSQRLTVTVMAAPTSLRLFPMDVHSCRLDVESYAHTSKDVNLLWHGKLRDALDGVTVESGNILLTRFGMYRYPPYNTTAHMSSGDYTRLHWEMALRRRACPYVLNIVVPSMLIVSVSFIAFWLHVEAQMARLAMGVTSVLSMALVIVATFASLPKVGHLRALDLYQFFCLAFAFAGLVLQIVIFRRRNGHFEQSIIEQRDSKPTEDPLLPDSSEPREGSSAKLDRFGRVVLPVAFVVFNVIFWAILTGLSVLAFKISRDCSVLSYYFMGCKS